MKWNVITHLTENCGFGSKTNLAKALGVNPNVITGMSKRNAITDKKKQEIILAGRKLGLEIVPNDFFPPDLRSDPETQDRAKA